MDTAKSDTLYGVKAIGAHVGMTGRQAKHRAAAGGMPTFKMGKTVCGSRAALDAWLADLAATARKLAA